MYIGNIVQMLWVIVEDLSMVTEYPPCSENYDLEVTAVCVRAQHAKLYFSMFTCNMIYYTTNCLISDVLITGLLYFLFLLIICYIENHSANFIVKVYAKQRRGFEFVYLIFQHFISS